MAIRIVGEYESISTACLLLPKDHLSEDRITVSWHFLEVTVSQTQSQGRPSFSFFIIIIFCFCFCFSTSRDIRNVGCDCMLSLPSAWILFLNHNN